ncbi:hypothetical protein L6164_013193 [Bauhinia variegata]|uniref:Uncharacterized protein n=1 Tax=Bauhinia variegata TaxID=167791 RepID=A0ACB9PCI7_BAUVA|nr:hypothetical protein L6164_013193 [Bauhinia variegata]
MWPMIPRSFSVFASILRIKRLNYYFLPQLINHGVPESLMEKVIRMTHQFHNMTSEEKTEFADNDISSSIRWGTSFNPKVESVHYWRDYLKVKTHQDFAFPHKPTGFKSTVKKIKGVVRNLLGGASESLGLESNAIAKTTGFENGLQHYVANLYPPCPQPELAMGLPAHSDHGLFTILILMESIASRLIMMESG